MLLLNQVKPDLSQLQDARVRMKGGLSSISFFLSWLALHMGQHGRAGKSIRHSTSRCRGLGQRPAKICCQKNGPVPTSAHGKRISHNFCHTFKKADETFDSTEMESLLRPNSAILKISLISTNIISFSPCGFIFTILLGHNSIYRVYKL